MFSVRKSPICHHGRGIVARSRSLLHQIPPTRELPCRHQKNRERWTEALPARSRGASVDKAHPWKQSRRWPVIRLLHRVTRPLSRSPRTTLGYTRSMRIRHLEPQNKLQKVGVIAVAIAAQILRKKVGRMLLEPQNPLQPSCRNAPPLHLALEPVENRLMGQFAI